MTKKFSCWHRTLNQAYCIRHTSSKLIFGHFFGQTYTYSTIEMDEREINQNINQKLHKEKFTKMKTNFL